MLVIFSISHQYNIIIKVNSLHDLPQINKIFLSSHLENDIEIVLLR